MGRGYLNCVCAFEAMTSLQAQHLRAYSCGIISIFHICSWCPSMRPHPPSVSAPCICLCTAEHNASQKWCWCFLSWKRWGERRMKFGSLLFSKPVRGSLWFCHSDLHWGWASCFRAVSGKAEKVSSLHWVSLSISSAILFVLAVFWFPCLCRTLTYDALIWMWCLTSFTSLIFSTDFTVLACCPTNAIVVVPTLIWKSRFF